MENKSESKKELGLEDKRNFSNAVRHWDDYLNIFAMADNEEMRRCEKLFLESVSKLSLDGKKVLNDYFNSIPESQRPSNPNNGLRGY